MTIEQSFYRQLTSVVGCFMVGILREQDTLTKRDNDYEKPPQNRMVSREMVWLY